MDVFSAAYDEIVSQLKLFNGSEKGNTAFRYAVKGRSLVLLSSLDSPCVWNFVTSESDFKASDIAMGRPLNRDSVNIILDLIPHKFFFFFLSLSRTDPLPSRSLRTSSAPYSRPRKVASSSAVTSYS